MAKFRENGVKLYAISYDDRQALAAFADNYGIDYPLLSDEDRTVAEAFGVKRGFGPLPNKRTTFVIDTDRRILDVISSEVRMNTHADQALATLRQRAGSPS